MLRVGIVGFGFMGRMHYNCWKDLTAAAVSAICDSDPDIVAKTNESCGNIAGAEGAIDLEGVKLYQDFETMLSDGNIDALSITVPTYLHAELSIKALEAGVDVLCEKPMALNSSQCRKMIEAANRTGRILQIGHCIRFWPEYARAKEIVDSGKYGRVIAATFKRLGTAPGWSADNWFADERRSGGMALDLHIHDTDFVQHLFGSPAAVCSFGAKGPFNELAHIVTAYSYDDDKVVVAEGSWAAMPSFGFEMSFNIVLEKATIVYDCIRQPTFKVYPADGDAFEPKIQEGDGYSLEIAHFARSLSGPEPAEVTSLEQSKNSVMIVEAEIESVRTGEKVFIDRQSL